MARKWTEKVPTKNYISVFSTWHNPLGFSETGFEGESDISWARAKLNLIEYSIGCNGVTIVSFHLIGASSSQASIANSMKFFGTQFRRVASPRIDTTNS